MAVERAALVAGGGVAGLSTALALSRAGVRCEVLEARSRLAEQGALLLWSNGMRALRALGVEASVLAAGVPLTSTEFRDARGGLLTTLPLAALAERHGAASIVVTRAALLEILASALPAGTVRFASTLESFELAVDRVEARTSQGTFAADMLIGADGLHSRIRTGLGIGGRVRDTGQVAVVGISERCDKSLAAGVAVATVGRGQRFWAARICSERAYWYATLRASEPLSHEAAELRRQLAERYVCWHAPIRALIEQTPEHAIVLTQSVDRTPVARWTAGRIALVGDSAQPCTPDLGQGACQAIESAVVLAECLAQHAEVAAAFRMYERRRMDHVARVAQLSFVTAMQSASSSVLACAVRDLGVKTLLRPLALQELDWILASPIRSLGAFPSDAT